MAILTLKNHKIMARINSFGAELQSFSLVNEPQSEVIWQAGEAWKRSAPWLFPVVGRLPSDNYAWEGRNYSMSQHGFARDQEFQTTSSTESELHLELMSSAQTKANYPFEFKLKIAYSLNEIGIKIQITVENLDTQTKLPFSLGFHPAFNILPNDQVTISKNLRCRVLNIDGGFDPQDVQILKNEFQVGEFKELNHALIARDPQVNSFSLIKAKQKLLMNWQPSVSGVAIWSRDINQFICLEPWWGGPQDNEPFAYELGPQIKKEFVIQLQLCQK